MENGKELYPKVSIIVPVKNGAEKIKDLLDSLMRVDYEKDKLEIIVVDGNSTDATMEIVSKYPVKLVTEERLGVNVARNTGIKNSSGEIIAFTDYDCVVPENWVKAIVSNFQDPEVGCVGGKILRYNNDFWSRYADESLMPVMRIFKKRKIIDRIKSPFYYPVGCNFAVRREAIKKVGFFDERFTYGFDELEFAERICGEGYKIVLTPDVMVRHKHRSTLSELMKQTFRYGQGGGLLPKTKGIKSIFSKWVLLSIIGFTLWVLMLLYLTFCALFVGSTGFMTVLLAFLFTPPAVLIVIYVYRTVKVGDDYYRRIVAYPLIDIARFLAFAAGGINCLLRTGSKEEKLGCTT